MFLISLYGADTSINTEAGAVPDTLPTPVLQYSGIPVPPPFSTEATGTPDDRIRANEELEYAPRRLPSDIFVDTPAANGLDDSREASPTPVLAVIDADRRIGRRLFTEGDSDDELEVSLDNLLNSQSNDNEVAISTSRNSSFYTKDTLECSLKL